MILTQKLIRKGDLYIICLSHQAVESFGWVEDEDIQFQPSTAMNGLTLCGPLRLFEARKKGPVKPNSKPPTKTP